MAEHKPVPANVSGVTIAALQRAIANAKPDTRTGAAFVNVDTRVLAALIDPVQNEAPAMLESLKEMVAVARCISGSFALRGEYGWDKHDEAELNKAQAILARIEGAAA